MRYEIDINAVMQRVPEIMGMELELRGGVWEGRYYINGERHAWKKDKLRVRLREFNGRMYVMVYEQGGEGISLENWLQRYGGCPDWRSARDVMRSCRPCGLELGLTRFATEAAVQYVEESEYERCRGLGFDGCNLYAWMCRLFGEETVRAVWDRYRVTSNERGEAVFWYTDPEGRILHDKIMRYCGNGRRDKTSGGYRRFTTAKGYTARCYFGAHLVGDGPLHLVESEKSALIMACVEPEKTWVACGGLNQVRDVDARMWLYPDIDGIAKWEAIPGAQIVPWWDSFDEVGDHDDIADAAVRQRMGDFSVSAGRYA